MPSSPREFFETIKVEHTIFALPFAYMTLFLVAGGWPSALDFLWVTVAMAGGRTFGMAANRLVDAKVDKSNPRTRDRAIPAGRLSAGATLGYMAVTLAVFLVAVWQLDPVCRKLWPVALAAMWVYPYAKRFTWMAHLFLGFVYFIIPAAIWLAVAGVLNQAAVVLGVGAALWVAGFDIIYACQDVEHDRAEGLHSMPADLGLRPALWISRAFHILFVLCLLYAGRLLDTGPFYTGGVAVAAAVLAWEHRLVRPDDLSRIGAAFFTANGVASIILFVFVALDAIL